MSLIRDGLWYLRSARLGLLDEKVCHVKAVLAHVDSLRWLSQSWTSQIHVSSHPALRFHYVSYIIRATADVPSGKAHRSCLRESYVTIHADGISVWLTYWQDYQFDRPLNFYEGIYALLGVAQATFTFLMGASMGIMSYWASNNLHSEALQHVFYSPMAVFDTQPLGRLMGVLGKDIDTVDNQLADALRMMALTLIAVSQAI